MFIIGGRKKILNRRRFNDINIKAIIPIAVLILLYIISFIIGNITGLKSGEKNDGIFFALFNYITELLNMNIFRMFLNFLLLTCTFEIIIFLFGISVPGVIVIPLSIAVYGLFAGAAGAYVFTFFENREAVTLLCSLMPGLSVFGTGLCMIGKWSFFISGNILMYSVNNSHSSKIDLKKYITANLIIILLAVICSLVCTLSVKLTTIIS